MPDRPPVRAEDIPQSVVARVVQARIILNEYDAAEEAAAIIAALQDEGYRLVRDDEATVNLRADRDSWRMLADLSRQRAEAAEQMRLRHDEATVERSVLEAIDHVEHITHSARAGRRWGVTRREAELYDKGYDDALNHVRTALALTAAQGDEK